MSKSIPFINRRGDNFTFRMAVPCNLRDLVGRREYTKSLGTSNRAIAQPIALELAALCKRLFYDLRILMAQNSDDISAELALLKLEVKMRKALRVIETNQALRTTESKVKLAEMTLKSQFLDLNFSNLKPVNLPNLIEPIPQEEVSPKLSLVIDAFLKNYNKTKHAAMFKKHQSALPMFLKVIGDKPVNTIKQMDIKGFFALLECLPPRWSDACRKRKLSITELAKIKHPLTISPKTFDSTYVACIRSFLTKSQTDWQDQGFPTTLTTDGIEYHGTRVEGENSQRPFKPNELTLLFGNKEMIKYANDESNAHKYWLPLIGLYTGARVNEICQINPQTDVLKDAHTNIWYFWITDITDGDERIHKRTKNLVSKRKVPIHTALLNRGIIAYIDKTKQEGHKLILPGFKPTRGKASGIAEKWFTEFLKITNLRDDTPHEKVTGMHAFRSTFSNAAMNAGVDESSITGHAHNVNDEQSNSSESKSSKVKRGYRRELSLLNKQKIIEQVIFDL